MIDPINAIGFASAAMGGVSQSAMDSFKHKENQKTIRTQSRMAAFSDASQCLSQLLAAYQNYQEIALEEGRRRDEISSWEKQNIAEIKARKEYILTYLEKNVFRKKGKFQKIV